MKNLASSQLRLEISLKSLLSPLKIEWKKSHFKIIPRELYFELETIAINWDFGINVHQHLGKKFKRGTGDVGVLKFKSSIKNLLDHIF